MTDTNQPNGFKYWVKTTLLFIGQSLLFCLGAFSLIATFVDFFEEDFGFSELSALEIIFIAAFIWLINRYVTVSKSIGLKWTSLLYRPLKYVGWYGLASLLFVVFWLINGVELHELSVFSATNSNRVQLMNLVLLLLCVHWATPNRNTETPIDESVINKAAES